MFLYFEGDRIVICSLGRSFVIKDDIGIVSCPSLLYVNHKIEKLIHTRSEIIQKHMNNEINLSIEFPQE